MGSELTSWYIFLSARCSRPSWTYFSVSSTTFPEPLAAFLMVNEGSELSSQRALLRVVVKFGFFLLGSSVFNSALILCR